MNDEIRLFKELLMGAEPPQHLLVLLDDAPPVVDSLLKREALIGPNEREALIGANEREALIGPNEREALIGPNERERP